MTKKIKNIALIILSLIILVAFFYAINLIQKKRDSRPFNYYEFPETLVVENYTEYRADTICLYLAHKILNLDTANISIAYIPSHINKGEMEYFGIVEKLNFGTNQFLILLHKDKISFSKLKILLCHEFVHINQYVRGDLELFGSFAIWKGDTIYPKEVDYMNRPFEKEAFSKEGDYLKKLNILLYD
jgi:hypothetical protein